jgi:peptidoglycan-associated lipoprotein
VKIEGHCDERGTIECNLVLSQKRADSTKNYLMSLGIGAKEIVAGSYGKEKPLDPGHDKAARAKDRRNHVVPLQSTVPARMRTIGFGFVVNE